MEKNRVSVTVNGREYAMISPEPEEYLYRVGVYVDKKVAEIVQAFPSISTTDAAVFAALTIADELLRIRNESERLGEKINSVLNGEHKEINKIEEKEQKNDTSKNKNGALQESNRKKRKDIFIPQVKGKR